jgi:hypothetical protein
VSDTVTGRRDGRRFVLALYAALVCLAGVGGALVGVFVPGMTSPALFFVLPLPPTPAGFALYGAATVAVALGLPLAAVRYVSRGVDDAGG